MKKYAFNPGAKKASKPVKPKPGGNLPVGMKFGVKKSKVKSPKLDADGDDDTVGAMMKNYKKY